MFRVFTHTPVVRPRCRRRGLPQACVPLVLALTACLARPAVAVDGMLEASGSSQEGRSGAEAYSSDNLRLRGSIDERVSFSRDLTLYVRYGALREKQENRTSISFSSYRKEIQDPYLALTYDAGGFEAGVYGNARRTDYFWFNQDNTRDDHVSGTAFASLDLGTVDLEARLTEGRADRTVDELRNETRDHRLALSARTRISADDRLQYEYSRAVNEVRTADYESRYRTHRFEYNGNRQFAADRGRASLTARYLDLEQEVVFGGDTGVRYLQPDWGGFVLDDTPGDLDPLEPDPTVVPGLHDLDRDTPTIINIGDSAPVVREYGGDYRNIIFDFGDLVEIGSAQLYVDTVLRFPELMRWEVYVSDDPEGRDWGAPLGPETVTWAYRQEANGRQGWSFSFATPVNHRRLKVVNSKLGATEPDIRITEFEVYGPAEAASPDFTSGNTRYRLTGTLGYRISRSLDVSYRGDFWWATYGDTDREDRSAGHFAEAAWTRGTWRVSGALTANKRTATSSRNTEVMGQRVVVMQRPRANLDWRVGWNRSADTSYGRDQVTNNVAGHLNWRAAPALVVTQKVAYGYRTDDIYDLQSSSWVLITNVRSSPRRTVGLDLMRSDRWVSAEAGAGFTTFNDTEARFSWAIFPHLTYSGLARYQVRDTADWIRRSILSLNPLPGGSMALAFYASLNEDTRADTRQRALGARATWRPRPSLMLEGGIERSQFTNGPNHSTPTNLSFRGYWTF